MSIKILFLFFNFFLIVLNLNLFAETIVSATKIKKLSNTKISIEAKAKAFTFDCQTQRYFLLKIAIGRHRIWFSK